MEKQLHSSPRAPVWSGSKSLALRLLARSGKHGPSIAAELAHLQMTPRRELGKSGLGLGLSRFMLRMSSFFV